MGTINNSMKGNIREMQQFVIKLKCQINDLIQSRDAAKAAIRKMKELGYDDTNFVRFEEIFENESKLIDVLNADLDKSIKFYNVSIQMMEDHLKNKYVGGLRF